MNICPVCEQRNRYRYACFDCWLELTTKKIDLEWPHEKIQEYFDKHYPETIISKRGIFYK